MKKILLAVVWAVFAFLFCSCVRTGEKDSIDFISSMIKCGYDCSISETLSGETLKESCYVNGCKLSLYSDGSGKLARISITYVPESRGEFLMLAQAAVRSFCLYGEEDINEIFTALGTGDYPPDDSSGVRRCNTEWYSFYFSCDETSGALEVVNLRLEPDGVPDVTLNTTVPFVSVNTEK